MGYQFNVFTGNFDLVNDDNDASYLTKTQADTYYYPLSTNPAGYLTAETDPIFTAWLGTHPYLPDQTVAISAGTNITSVTGTYPNFTINAANQTTSLAGETLDVITGRGATTTNDIRVGDIALTRTPITINRDASGYITSIVKTGGRTITPTRNASNYITSITDAINTWTFTRNASNLITAVAVT